MALSGLDSSEACSEQPGPRLAERPAGASGSLGKFAPNDDPAATLLGKEPWRWLEGQLRQPAEVRLIASSGQIVPDEKGMDEWGNYPLERQRLFDLIEESGAKNASSFSRFFRRMYGVSPKEYRRQRISALPEELNGAGGRPRDPELVGRAARGELRAKAKEP